MTHNFDYKNFVLVTNCFNEGEDCLYFTCNLTSTDIYKALKAKNVHFDECYSIKESEISFYCFDPVYLDEKLETGILKAASSYK